MQKEKKENKSNGTIKDRDKFIEEIINEVYTDYENRKKLRLPFERQWELNMNFLVGNQYYGINNKGELMLEDKDFYWQKRSVYNHIAPIIESRLAKLARVRPILSVRPVSNDDLDIDNAQKSQELLNLCLKKNNIENVVKQATSWSETLGTAFYKITWNNQGGKLLGVYDNKDVYEGDVTISAISPFEIFIDNISCESIDGLNSIIEARAMSVDEIENTYGVSVKGERIDIFSLNKCSEKISSKTTKKYVENSAVVIEKYEKPSKYFPLGRLITVCNGKLLYYGDLPYINGENGKRVFPFIKQESIAVSGCFYGQSIIERLIPIQKSYNAVKNRKQEFLNRLSMGIMTVEDGSVDVDDLALDGLSPGKIIVYRQGGKAPEIMDETKISPDFSSEEEKLLNEFVAVSGISDVSSSFTSAKFSSGNALQLLIEQDNERLTMNAELIRNSYVEISKMCLKLYKQFATNIRVVNSIKANGKPKLYFIDNKNIYQDDVYIENANELLYTESQKNDMIFKLYESGLLNDADDKVRSVTKEKVLGLLGYRDLDSSKGLSRLQQEKAQRENDMCDKKEIKVEEIDDNKIHIDEHTRYILCEYGDLTDEKKRILMEHVKQHKIKMGLENNKEA